MFFPNVHFFLSFLVVLKAKPRMTNNQQLPTVNRKFF